MLWTTLCPFDPYTDKQASLISNSPVSFFRDCLRSYASDVYSMYYFYIISKKLWRQLWSYMLFPFKKVILPMEIHMASCAYLPQTCSNTLSLQKNSNICPTIHTALVKSAPGHLFIVQLRITLRSDFLRHSGGQPNWAKASVCSSSQNVCAHAQECIYVDRSLHRDFKATVPTFLYVSSNTAGRDNTAIT